MKKGQRKQHPRTERITALFTAEDIRLIKRMAGTTPLSLWVYQHIAPIIEGAKAKEEQG